MRSGGAHVVLAPGAVHRVRDLVDGYAAERVLVVASTNGVQRAGLDRWLDDPRYRLFSAFRPNPDLSDVLAGCALRDEWRPSLVVGLGGGSAMDVAKLVRALPADRTRALACLTDAPENLSTGVGTLVLVPTTSGTGSEVTRFATVFDGYRKHSFDHPLAAATLSVVDPELTATCPREVVTSCAADALCHAVESLWARRSTPGSRADALRALRGLTALTAEQIRDNDRAVRERLARAALDAGAAINVTRTTAAHAFAYPLTRRHGVPHGVACLLNLRWVYAYNTRRLDAYCEDPRGTAHVRAQLDAVASACRTDVAGVPVHLAGLLSDLGWSPHLSDYGVSSDDVAGFVGAGLGATARASNNPVRLVPDLVARAIEEIR